MDKLLERVSDSKDMPLWNDELYLEYHRGTYTSMGQNKKYNRKLELLLKEAEILAVCANVSAGAKYPEKELMDAWKILMLNQFHDILPGSSIEEVYEDSKKQYEEAIAITQGIIDSAADALCNEIDIKEREKSESGLSNEELADGSLCVSTPFYEAKFDQNGEIVSLYDKELKRELRNPLDAPFNRLIAFEDKPKDYDAWNIDSDFENVSWNLDKAEKIEVNAPEGDEASLWISVEISRKFRNSDIHQSIVFNADSRRIDFITKADWHEHQTLLKAAFPVAVESKEICCEIQYGSLKRKLTRDNSFERAKFECCAHKWIDITDDSGDFGVAILNDCKYGYDAKEKLMRLTLIKSGIFPNPNADQGIHEFTYSLLPHKGDLTEGKVIEEARALNFGSHYYAPKKFEPSFEALPGTHAQKSATIRFLEECEKGLVELTDARGIFIEAIKMAEDGRDIVVRMYEGYGRETNANVKLFKDYDICPKEVAICDLLENCIGEETSYEKSGKTLCLTFKPFEIKTIRIRL